jgi:hypothetical protein
MLLGAGALFPLVLSSALLLGSPASFALSDEKRKQPKRSGPYDPCPHCGGRVAAERNDAGEMVAVFCTKCDDYYLDYK